MNESPTKKRKKRKGIGAKLRFEVLKRDSFKCQYCGASAQDNNNTLLHVDHIDPVVSGGDNSIINLTTSCATCNFGKGGTKLTDNAVLLKQRVQLEEMEALKQQREWMIRWREELKALDESTIEELANYWSRVAEGYSLNESGRQKLRTLLKKYSVDDIMFAMDESQKYLKYNQEGGVTPRSVETAWEKVASICYVRNQTKDDPKLAELFKIRSFLANKQSWRGSFDKPMCLNWLKAAESWGVTIEELREIAGRANTWTELSECIDIAIEQAKACQEESEEEDWHLALWEACCEWAERYCEWSLGGEEDEELDPDSCALELSSYIERKLEHDTESNRSDAAIIVRHLNDQTHPFTKLQEVKYKFEALWELVTRMNSDGEGTLELHRILKRRIENPSIAPEDL